MSSEKTPTREVVITLTLTLTLPSTDHLFTLKTALEHHATRCMRQGLIEPSMRARKVLAAVRKAETQAKRKSNTNATAT
jgi:hypothetical protein